MTHEAKNHQREALIADGSVRAALVVSQYHSEITDSLLQAARQTLIDLGWVTDGIDVYRVPGAWELPLACQWILDLNQHQGVIALGAVIRGETSHDQHINRFVSMALGRLALDAGVPLAFGLLTCDSLDQARARSGGQLGNKGAEAAEALISMINLKRRLDEAAAG